MHLNLKQIVLLFAGIGLLLSVAQAQKRAVDAEGHEWWKHAVFYEVYPRSFADSNNDGIGDLKGIDLHLDYLKDLGVDAIWITPCYPSPQVDFGYDVSDYENIDPMYGTLKDFKHLAREDVYKRQSKYQTPPYGARQIPYSKLTHINHFGVSFGSDGTLYIPDGFVEPALIRKAHKAGVKVLLGLGGDFSALDGDPNLTAILVGNLRTFIDEKGYDLSLIHSDWSG